MDWKDEEVEQAWSVLRTEGMRQVMTRTVELLAARGGTMTADGEHVFDATTEDGGRVWVESTGEWGHEGGNISWAIDALAAHVVALRAAQGARVAVLEAELENVRPFEALHADLSAQLRDAWEDTGVAGTVKGMTTLADVVGVTKADLREALAEIENLRERLTAAEEGSRELVRRAQQAEADRDRWKTEHGSSMRRWKAEKDNAETWRKRVEAAAEVAAAISAVGAGQVVSAHVDRTELISRDMDLMCIACAQCTLHRWQPSPDAGPGWRCSECSALSTANRHPCSSTCTHDDAATPGHAERVKVRSEAFGRGRRTFKDAEEENVWADGWEDGLKTGEEKGAEAMRAACWKAAQLVLQRYGYSGVGPDPALWHGLKSAIEGAAP